MVNNKATVLVTGISGWIAQFCAVELIKEGYTVRGSLRTMSRKEEVIKALSTQVDVNGKLEFCQLDLLDNNGWLEAMQGCEYVMHIASPFIMTEPKDENEYIKPAIDGTLRALKYAHKAGVKRVVLTSSLVSVMGDVKAGNLTPDSWSSRDRNSRLPAYQKSKTLAESAAWEFVQSQPKDGHQLELVTINPGAVLGPALSQDIHGASLDICVQLLTKKMPGIPNLKIAMVDVRDVAVHHFKAMIEPAAKNKRILSCFEKPTHFLDFATTLKENGYDVPTKKLPTLLVKFLSIFDRDAKAMLPFLDRSISFDISQTEKLFNWKPIPLKTTFLDMARSVSEILNNQSKN